MCRGCVAAAKKRKKRCVISMSCLLISMSFLMIWISSNPTYHKEIGQKMGDLFTTRRQVVGLTLWAMTMWQDSHQPVVPL